MDNRRSPIKSLRIIQIITDNCTNIRIACGVAALLVIAKDLLINKSFASLKVLPIGLLFLICNFIYVRLTYKPRYVSAFFAFCALSYYLFILASTVLALFGALFFKLPTELPIILLFVLSAYSKFPPYKDYTSKD